MRRHPFFCLLGSLSTSLALAGCAGADDTSDDLADLGTSEAPLTKSLPPIVEPVITGSAAPTFEELLGRYSTYDKNGDGTDEINTLTKSAVDDGRGAGSRGTVLVLVEKRIMTQGSPSVLRQRLATFRDDLALEGYGARFVDADVYAGASHQDGLTVLALRDYVKAFRSSFPSTRGVLLVGHFPHATLLLRAMRVQDSAKIDGVETSNVLSVTVDRINPKSDLVLGDMDGKWEQLYRKAPRALPVWKVKVHGTQAWPAANAWYESATHEYKTVTWEDYFDVRDEVTWTAGPTTDSTGVAKLKVYVGKTTPDNPEISSSDASLPNPLARPEVFVSRIDAKMIAHQPSAPADLDGKRPLDAAGKPQRLRYAAIGAPTSIPLAHDLAFEQTLLADYFARNHAYRRIASSRPSWRVSTIRSASALNLMSPASMNARLETAGTGWLAERASDNADLTDVANWAASSATMKGIVAHSEPKASDIPSPTDLAGLATALGSTPFAWRRETLGSEVVFTPDVASLPRNRLSWPMLRTLYAGARTPRSRGTFLVHEGCDVTNPGNETEDMPWSDAEYGRRNVGDATMFFLNGLSLYGRAKVFYDSPDGYLKGLAGSSATLGHGWRAHFDHDAALGEIRDEIYKHKRAYYWNLDGDWTLRVRY